MPNEVLRLVLDFALVHDRLYYQQTILPYFEPPLPGKLTFSGSSAWRVVLVVAVLLRLLLLVGAVLLLPRLLLVFAVRLVLRVCVGACMHT